MSYEVLKEQQIGEYCEELPWRLVKDVEIFPRGDVCVHVINLRIRPDFVMGDKVGTLPYGIETRSKGGCNSTLLCADCVWAVLIAEDDRVRQRGIRRWFNW